MPNRYFFRRNSPFLPKNAKIFRKVFKFGGNHGLSKIILLWVTPEKNLSILQSGEILKKQSAAVNIVMSLFYHMPYHVKKYTNSVEPMVSCVFVPD